MDEANFSHDLLIGLTPEQREAVMSPARRHLVRATAGSGKTHVLTLRIQRRVADQEIAPDQILAMTFTRKAGDELRKRLFRAGVRDVRAGTFHRAALNIVTQYREDHHLRPLTLEPNRRKLVSALATQLRDSGELKLEDWQLPRLEQEIGWALSQGYNGTTYAKHARKLRREAPLPPAQLAEVLDRYVGLCRSRGLLDFDLLLSEAISLLRDEPDVLASFRYRNRSLYVDETQDMNPLQFMLLRQMAGDDPDLFCVGDPNQSIYGFNGATPTLINEILTTWPDTVVLDLTRNHRSTANIIAVANTLLEPGARGIEPAKDEGEVPLIRSYDTDEEEAEHVATWLAAKHQTPNWNWSRATWTRRMFRTSDAVPSTPPPPISWLPNPRVGAWKSSIATRWPCRRFTARRAWSSNMSPRSAGPKVSCPTTTPPRPSSWPKSSASPMWR
jgi:DNA helicase II / ATP-dependent DNA helicase PcrA